jgi:5-formyltetrahydrofolate cyclo-ligase
MNKSEIRTLILAKRNSASPEWRAMASRDLARHAVPHLASAPGGPVAGYWPYKSEADSRPLMELMADYGRTLALPVIDHPQIMFRRWIMGVDLVDAGFGTLGPDASADMLRPAVVLVPLAAFDRSGHRIGWGQGHYDRVIAQLAGDGAPLLTVGIAFSFQQIEHVPAEVHDRPLDLIATELGIIRPASQGG